MDTFIVQTFGDIGYVKSAMVQVDQVTGTNKIFNVYLYLDKFLGDTW